MSSKHHNAARRIVLPRLPFQAAQWLHAAGCLILIPTAVANRMWPQNSFAAVAMVDPEARNDAL